jgi:predicted anti-sigma-YlaC factor YlaD
MDCEKIQELFSPYLDNDLTLKERTAVDAHLKTCPDCAGLLSLMKTAASSLAAFPEIEPSRELRNKLRAIPGRTKRFRAGLSFFLKPALQPVFAAVTGFLVLFSLYMFNPDKKHINQAISRTFQRGVGQIEKLYAKAGSLTDNLGDYAHSVLISLKKINPLGKSAD